MAKPIIVLRSSRVNRASQSLLRVLALLAALSLLAACGLKGDLYLPTEQPAPAPAPTTEQQDDDAGTHS